MKFFLSRNRHDPRRFDAGVVWGDRHWSESDNFAVFTTRPSTLVIIVAVLAGLSLAIGLLS